MSRIGKKPITIPKGVEIKQNGATLQVTGPKGTLTETVPATLKIEIANGEILVNPVQESDSVKAIWGLYRMLINNLVEGVTAGFSKTLDIIGVGYKAELKGKDVNINAGLSYPVLVKAKPGITFVVNNATQIVISGINKQVVGQVAADIRGIRPPEPYKGKGIRYSTEQIKLKAGKATVK